MVGILILTHGGMAAELLAATRMISGELKGFEALVLDWDETFDHATSRVREAIARLEVGGEGVLILTDIFGGTPSNVAMQFLEPGRVELIAGVNLPMLVRIACARPCALSLEELAPLICEKGQTSICHRAEPGCPVEAKAGCNDKPRLDE